MPKNTHDAERHPMAAARCAECGAREVRPAVIEYTAKKNHDGRIYDLHIHDLNVTRCAKCGEIYFDAAADDQITAALRSQLVLLLPEQIARNIETLGLSQKDFANRLGV